MTGKTRNLCKKILHNPFFIALLLTVLAMIIIVAAFKNYSYGGAANVFKIGFYMFICFSIILFLNNMFLKRTMANTHIKTEVKEVFTGIDMSKEMSHDVIEINPNLYEDQNILGGDIGTADKFKSTNNYFVSRGDNNSASASNNSASASNDSASASNASASNVSASNNSASANNNSANNINYSNNSASASNNSASNNSASNVNYSNNSASNINYSNNSANNINYSNVSANNVNYSNNSASNEEKKDINTILDSIITISSNHPIPSNPPISTQSISNPPI